MRFTVIERCRVGRHVLTPGNTHDAADFDLSEDQLAALHDCALIKVDGRESPNERAGVNVSVQPVAGQHGVATSKA